MLRNNVSYTNLLSSEILTHLEQRGIEDFYPPQWDALKIGLTGQNMVVAIPTASGKTLIAEIIALVRILARKRQYKNHLSKIGKILYLCPLKALAAEKFREFKSNWADFGLKIGISTSDIDTPDSSVFKNDLIILTNEKADAILRMNPKLIEDLQLIICDEIHLLNDETRGITLEFLLTLFQTLKPELQIIGLSATIANAQELADWLNGTLITSDWRPVTLKEGFLVKNEIHFQDGSLRRITEQPTLNATESLVVDMLQEGGQVLVFTNSRRSAIATADALSKKIQNQATKKEKLSFSAIQAEYTKIAHDDTNLSKSLQRILKGGVAFHHAGLKSKQLNFVVDGFNQHQIQVICCTPTLAAGVNTPARRVIVKSLYRFSGDKGNHLIPIIEYKQMAGRAGRPRYDPYGEVVIIGTNPERLIENALSYINGIPESITSKLSEETQLHGHLLGLIAAKIASNKQDLIAFLMNSFYYYQMINGTCIPSPQTNIKESFHQYSSKQLTDQMRKTRKLRLKGRGSDPLGDFDDSQNMFQTADRIWTKTQDNQPRNSNLDEKTPFATAKLDPVKIKIITHQITRILSYFNNYDLTVTHDTDPPGEISLQSSTLSITPFGKITTRTYIPPMDAILLREDFQYAKQLVKTGEINLTVISWLHLITKVSVFYKPFLQKSDYPLIHSFLEEHWESFIMEEIWTPQSPEYPNFAQEIKLTLILRDWINEDHERNITENFHIGAGDLYRFISTAQWIFRSFLQIIKLEDDTNLHSQINNLYDRVRFGVKPSALPLIQLKGVGRVRARKLFQAGIKTDTQLQEATLDELKAVPLIGKTLAQSIYTQIHNPEALTKKMVRKNKNSQQAGHQAKYRLKKKEPPSKSTLDTFLNPAKDKKHE